MRVVDGGEEFFAPTSGQLMFDRLGDKATAVSFKPVDRSLRSVQRIT